MSNYNWLNSNNNFVCLLSKPVCFQHYFCRNLLFGQPWVILVKNKILHIPRLKRALLYLGFFFQTLILQELEQLDPEYIGTICGSYRRGTILYIQYEQHSEQYLCFTLCMRIKTLNATFCGIFRSRLER